MRGPFYELRKLLKISLLKIYSLSSRTKISAALRTLSA